MAPHGRRDAPAVLITGGGRGIGRATAVAFAAEGYRVAIAELRDALGRSAARALRRSGAEALILLADVADPAAAERAAREVRRAYGRIDCLVNNAGILRVGPLAKLPAGAIERILAVNLRGPLLMTRAVLPAMVRRHAGAIVNVASLLGKMGMGDYVTYCASKFGVVGMTEALADELRGSGVSVWAVCPGQVDTAMARAAGASAADRAGLIRPETVARVILDLATGRRRAPSGAAVDVT
ncbi:MAG: SDR family NAD(P)-dependent oxidoreductase [Candidatus Methylomirabilales bacterium]